MSPPTITLHQLPPAETLTGGEIVPVDNGTATLRTTVTAIRSGLAAASHDHAIAAVAGLQGALDGKAPLDSPALAGAPTAPTPPTADDGARIATTGFVKGQNYITAGQAPVRSVAGRAGDVVLAQTDIAGLTPASTPVFSGAVIGTNMIDNGRMELGELGDGDRWAYIDFHAAGGPSSTDYSARLVRAPGIDGAVALLNTGNGGVEVWAADGIQLAVTTTAGANRSVTVTGSTGGDPAIGTSAGRLNLTAIPALPGYTTATLPTATARGLAYVSDGSGNRRLAVADGTAWRWPDGTAVN